MARTDPADVARVERRTVIATEDQRDTIPIPKTGVKGQLGYWMDTEDMDTELNMRFPGCMRGMFVNILGIIFQMMVRYLKFPQSQD